MISDHVAGEENVKAGKDDGSNIFKSYSITFFHTCSFCELNWKLKPTFSFSYMFMHAFHERKELYDRA